MIASEDSQLFQADADVAAKERRLQKKNLSLGNAYECPSQANSVAVNDAFAYIGESSFLVRKLDLTVREDIIVLIFLVQKVNQDVQRASGPRDGCSLDGDEWSFTGRLCLVGQDSQSFWWKGNQSYLLFQSKTGVNEATYGEHTDFVKCIAFAHQKKLLASGSSDKTIVIRFLNEDHRTPVIIKAHTRGIESLVFDEEEVFLFSGSSDTTVKQVKKEENQFMFT